MVQPWGIPFADYSFKSLFSVQLGSSSGTTVAPRKVGRPLAASSGSGEDCK